MLLKWLFTLLAIVWLYESLTRIARDKAKERLRERERDNWNNDYIDYEEISSRKKK